METASVVFEHPFDKATLEQIGNLRNLRLQMAESMLRDLSQTKSALLDRGLITDVKSDELRHELMSRVVMLRQRLKEPEIIYADELDLYIDLLSQEVDCED